MQLIKPMLAKSSTLPVNTAEYGYEIKWDGIRAITYLNSGSIKILSRNDLDITKFYPELAKLGLKMPRQQAVIDGEIIVLDSNGKPSFELMQQRLGLAENKISTKSKQLPVTYIIFDLLYLNHSIINNPFVTRRELLATLKLNDEFWQTPAYKLGDGQIFLSASRSLALEGIVAKKLNSKYLPGARTNDWLKIKNQLRQELVIGGWTSGKGRRQELLGALLVGYYQNNDLIYAGQVGSGFKDDDLLKLKSLLTPLARTESPFASSVKNKQAHFVEPMLVGEFEFTQWTSNHTLRHPVYKGLRFDKDARTVTRETY